MSKFQLCRKHIGLDLTETADFTNSKWECIYCVRAYNIAWYHKKKNKGHPNEQVPFTVEQNSERLIKPPKIKSTKEEIYQRSKAVQKVKRDNLADSYVKYKAVKGTSLKAKDIPDEFVECYRDLLKLKRAIRSLK